MKASIHIKIFIILLAFSLGPLAISRGLMGRASGKAVKNTSEELHRELVFIVASELEYNATSLLSLLERGGETMKLAVRALSMDTRRILEKNQGDPATPIYFSRDFNTPETAPPDTRTHTGYNRLTMSGRELPIKISFDFSSAHIPQMMRRNSVPQNSTRHQELLLLQQLTPTMRDLLKDMMDAPFWFNIGLESGAFISYPGHGGFPHMYDHRNQEWYQKTRDSNEWKFYLTVDPATRATVTTIAFPIHSVAGKFLGCVSLDLPSFAFMGEEDLKKRWDGEIQSFMVYRDASGDAQDKGLPILAEKESRPNGHRHWMSGVEKKWLTFDDPVGTEVLLHAMDMQKSGVVPLSYKGEDSVCAFASNTYFSFIIIAPKSVVSKLPNAVAGSLEFLFDEMRNISLITSGIMLIFTGLIAWFGSRLITRPLLTMTQVARRLANGDFSARMTQRTGDERDDLVDSFNDMGPKLKELMHLNKDMELAEEVQRLLLPTSEPCQEGFDISGGISYCDQTGGDYYDFLNVKCQDGDALGVVLGDVSGHGLPSALVMAAARGQFHTLSKICMAPHERMNSINEVLSRDLDGTGRFLTVFYLRLKKNDPTVNWIRAGHDPAIRYNPATDTFGELSGEGLPLGVLEEYEYESNEATLLEGEILVLSTDGVWEARDASGEMFGKQRMLAIIRKNAQKNAEGIRLALMEAVEQYQAHGQEDDIAVVVIRKNSRTCMPEKNFAFRMSNKENCFRKFQPEVEAFGASHNLPGKTIFQLTLVLDELITNIIQYGYTDFDEHPIDVSLSMDGDMITIQVEDDSEPFNILEAPEPELDVPLDERDRQIGGMGIHLIKNMVNDINYGRKNGKNVLTLHKDISKPCPKISA
ncbi:SpoIIE family protein phosphatase [Pseudodesulfovibrio sp. JC047]|uniref:SpoIIE family protein phosphatase n=1 Tax=Pseudodesulfovibrio sp. JC047 TaxID=2683199 RepID=UPI0013D64343|nr:SpoIIE family protein phosphatase [Pseudodesulfovibrio sp. JC047]NDV20762.1 SpoIIE family protein phosphatase [Pseudodesulfovibrio sp. JC047]